MPKTKKTSQKSISRIPTTPPVAKKVASRKLVNGRWLTYEEWLNNNDLYSGLSSLISIQLEYMG
jgi:hypothetical protein